MDRYNQSHSHLGEILIVDDTSANLRLLATLLRQQGYAIRCAIAGQTALRSVQFRSPDLILLDIMMPEMDGYEVCRQLKANHATAEIPVIFISSLDAVSQAEQILSVGGMDYIAKPYQIQDVVTKVEKALSGDSTATKVVA